MSGDVLPSWVTERYEVGEPIGDGLYARVYRAKGPDGQAVAVKVLRPEHRDVPRIKDRFLTEAKAMARLDHPNIVKVIDVGEGQSGPAAIVMEYVAGGDLRKFVPRGGLDPARGARLALFVLAGLFAAHKAGVTHRGLCPEAVLMGPDEMPKLSDFGTARLDLHSKVVATMTVESLGSLFYTSPEQRGKPRDVDGRTDIYSMGALLYFLLIGRDPPDLSAASEAPALVAKVHEAVRPIVVTATRALPKDRFQSAAEMGRTLRALFKS